MLATNSITNNSHQIGMIRSHSYSDKLEVLKDIHQDFYNMVIWKRILSPDYQQAINDFIASNKMLKFDKKVSPQNIRSVMYEAFQGSVGLLDLSEDIAELVDTFCHLFSLTHAQLNLVTLERTMCPRFHVDKIPCRLVTTYTGNATEWLANPSVDRTKLGIGNNGFPDELSGIYQQSNEIQQLNNGDVALMKGTLWEGNENNGLVHRSPSVKPGQSRLFLALDFIA